MKAALTREEKLIRAAKRLRREIDTRMRDQSVALTIEDATLLLEAYGKRNVEK